MIKTAVIAIGGNALLKPSDDGTAQRQFTNVKNVANRIAEVVKMGYNVVITHGNGPQVGNILLRNDIAEGIVPPMPMDVCVAESQGQMGYMIQQSLQNSFRVQDLDVKVASIITQVVVDKDDEAFENPRKPVGPYYHEDKAQKLSKEKNWTMMQDYAQRGYRRVVPSPEPKEIVESRFICDLLRMNEGRSVIIALGGGGVPVIRTENGFAGVEAVCDKDISSQLLATAIGASHLVMLTDVPAVSLDFGTPSQKDLGEITTSQAKQYLREGQFPPGSMGPKVLSAIRFLESGGKLVAITTFDNLVLALENKKGTRVILG